MALKEQWLDVPEDFAGQVEASKVKEAVTSITTNREETNDLEISIKEEVDRAK